MPNIKPDRFVVYITEQCNDGRSEVRTHRSNGVTLHYTDYAHAQRCARSFVPTTHTYDGGEQWSQFATAGELKNSPLISKLDPNNYS